MNVAIAIQIFQTEVRGEMTNLIYSSLRDDEDFAEMLPYFVGELPQKHLLLNDLAQSKDIDNLRREAHKLRGSAGGYGFSGLSDLAGRLEDSCKNAPLDETAILRNLDELLDHLARVRA